MPHNRFFLKSSFQKTDILSVIGKELHHLNVGRIRLKEKVELVNGKRQLAIGSVIQIEKTCVQVEILSVVTEDTKPSIIIAQGIAKMNHLEWIIEKATELNATEFWLFPAELSEKKGVSDQQLHRLQALSIAALKQCGRLDLPRIEIKPPLNQWQQVKTTLLVSDPSIQNPYLWEMPKNDLIPPIIFCIGPEKGLSDREKSYAISHLHAKPIRLHSNILRTETASLVALSLIQSKIKI
ncbi:RsmE family RNA methyltransferase [Candidatus Rhabdochlamydia porcellionis]|uniref:Ribosomal RNA small subunit methyltransferase E n=1 Tax=Candidatus Rhabdochlamydia porcellionis TaxID=225148 RepID=A0ABX8Z3G8_9BACT|nr:RsmE family RNA methyltransferase [Candidatus Rhabdochlamydia porcellionis]QZA58627.1 Ribosomal RNA small subunit methyltransferase E [Candidatus Rhabdochlamydia porcellionis]